jgi:hypothetical protein
MTYELKRVEPMKAANIAALVYGLLMFAFMIILSPIFVLAVLFDPSGGIGAMGMVFPLLFLVVYPILGLVMGWLSGLLSAVIYNCVARWIGGLLFDLDGTALGTVPARSDA